ncbi:HEAT repeat domain-containing protein [Streptomyces sp. NPDC051940]|uniref:HEAT repeat domain-containing protein n=1 Tax=Streptomyces sp. NPDC051940 TaxID=3155675 RepID=UPI0034461BF5
MKAEPIAARSWGELRDLVRTAPVDEVVELFETGLHARIGTASLMAAERLGPMRHPGAVDIAIRALDSADPRLWTSSAIRLLSLARAEQAVPALARFVRTPGAGGTGALEALVRIGTGEATAALLDLGRTAVADPALAGRPGAGALVWALSTTGTSEARDLVLELTRTMSAPWDERAMWAVARIADERFEPFLLELCAGPYVRQGLSGLERTATARSVPALRLRLAAAGDRAVRYSAARALAHAGAAAASALSPSAWWNRDAEVPVRRATAWVLGRTGAPEYATVPGLTRLLADDDPGVRARAAESLGRVEGARAAPQLREALATDPSHRVRARAATALGRLAGRGTRGALREAARRDPVACVRDAAHAALRRL